MAEIIPFPRHEPILALVDMLKAAGKPVQRRKPFAGYWDRASLSERRRILKAWLYPETTISIMLHWKGRDVAMIAALNGEPR